MSNVASKQKKKTYRRPTKFRRRAHVNGRKYEMIPSIRTPRGFWKRTGAKRNVDWMTPLHQGQRTGNFTYWAALK